MYTMDFPRTRLGEPSTWIASVSRLLRHDGIALSPRGAGRAREPARALVSATAQGLLTDLYLRNRRTTAEIGALCHTSGTTVRRLLRGQGIRARTTGGANREHRTTLSVDLLGKLYLQDARRR
jgi:hypothetical protein